MAVKLVAGLLKDHDRSPPVRQLSSRVVTTWSRFEAPGALGWGYTPPLGNSVRLLGVSVYFSPPREAAGEFIHYGFHVGHTRPQSAAEVQAWESVLPVFMPDDRVGYFTQVGRSDAMSWVMNLFFTGQEIRFGAWVQGSIAVDWLEMYASFQIAEV